MSHITRWRLVGTIIWTLVPLYILLSFAHWLAPDSLDEYSAFTPFLALVCLQAYYISRKHKFSANWSGFNPTAGIGSTLHFWIRAQFVPSIPLAIMHATTLTALYRTLYSIPSTQGLCLHEHHILLHTVSWIYAAFNTEALLFVFPRLHRTRWQRVRQILPQCIKTSLTRTGPVLVLAYVTHVLLAPLLVSLLTYIAHSLGWYAHHCSAPVTTDTDTDFRSSMTEVCTVTEGASVTEFSEQSVGPWLSNLTLLDAVLPKLVLVTLLCAFIESYLYQLTQIIFTEVRTNEVILAKLGTHVPVVTATLVERRLLPRTSAAHSASGRSATASTRAAGPGRFGAVCAAHSPRHLRRSDWTHVAVSARCHLFDTDDIQCASRHPVDTCQCRAVPRPGHEISTGNLAHSAAAVSSVFAAISVSRHAAVHVVRARPLAADSILERGRSFGPGDEQSGGAGHAQHTAAHLVAAQSVLSAVAAPLSRQHCSARSSSLGRAAQCPAAGNHHIYLHHHDDLLRKSRTVQLLSRACIDTARFC
jgi:hypothetical protein